MDMAVMVFMLILGVVFISPVLAVAAWVLTLALRVVMGLFHAVLWLVDAGTRRVRKVELEREQEPARKEWGADWVDD